MLVYILTWLAGEVPVMSQLSALKPSS